MWRIDYRVGLMLGSNHAVLRLSRQMIMQAGHRKMMEKVWGWGWNQDIFWTGVNRTCWTVKGEKSSRTRGLGDWASGRRQYFHWDGECATAEFSLWGGLLVEPGFCLSAWLEMKCKYLNKSLKCKAGFKRQEQNKELRNSLHMMSTMQTLLHPLTTFPSSTLQPQLSFCPLHGSTLVLPQGLCTSCSHPLAHPSLVFSQGQIFFLLLIFCSKVISSGRRSPMT